MKNYVFDGRSFSMKSIVSIGLLLLSWACCRVSLAQASPSLPTIQKIKAVTVDGDLSEWKDVPFIRTGNSEQVNKPLQWKGAADASFNLYYGWNEAGLYVAARVFDDSLLNKDLL